MRDLVRKIWLLFVIEEFIVAAAAVEAATPLKVLFHTIDRCESKLANYLSSSLLINEALGDFDLTKWRYDCLSAGSMLKLVFLILVALWGCYEWSKLDKLSTSCFNTISVRLPALWFKCERVRWACSVLSDPRRKNPRWGTPPLPPRLVLSEFSMIGES